MSSTNRQMLANAIRFLSQDAVQKANSGHPGMPMGMADIAEVLWRDFLKHNPKNPRWANRDRFVLSNGHGAMLQYALLHLSGYDLTIEDIKQFRQLHSKTPGHPEFGETPGVETTTGPLGQGLANGVGMALAEKMLGAHFNQKDQSIVDHYTYVFAGDGCLMEGISHEVCSLAGTWKLGKLIVFWDDNNISIDGNVQGWFSENVGKRFEAYDWQVIRSVDGHNPNEIKKAIQIAQKNKEQPTLICCKTIIGFGAPNLAGTSKVHGSPLGNDEIAQTRQKLDWDHEPFSIPDDIYKAWNATVAGQAAESDWKKILGNYKKSHPDLALEFERRKSGELPKELQEKIKHYFDFVFQNGATVATRKASGDFLAAIAPSIPEIVGGSADLTGSNNTIWPEATVLTDKSFDANYIHYGVREFGMAAMMNGMALYGGFIPFGGTFLVFQSYCANAVRMSALMKQRVIYVFTHDSIGLGEDGPTHQPVAEAANLRLTPNVNVWRPADALETVAAWDHALNNMMGPSALLLSRQGLPELRRRKETADQIKRGAYVIYELTENFSAIIIATGSEVHIAIQAAELLAEKNIHVRVVSMPSCEVFLQQEQVYQASVLPSNKTKRVAVEALAADYWYRFVGLNGKVVGLNRFGASAPAEILYEEFKITPAHIALVAAELVGE